MGVRFVSYKPCFLGRAFAGNYSSWRGVMETTLYSRSLLSTSSTCNSSMSDMAIV